MNPHRLLITGAAGRIGSAFARAQYSAYQLRLADLAVDSLADVAAERVRLDVTDPVSCRRACEGMDSVIHLAGDPSPQADFLTSLLPTNLVGTYHMFAAAQACGCRRFVFASSAQAVEGYPLDVQVREDMPTRPGNLYGVTKVFGEALASYFSMEFGMVCVAVRIANLARFEAGQVHRARDVAAFISERDVVHLLVRCVEAELSGFNVVHGVSDNRYKRLAIERTRELLGYRPADDAFVILEGDASSG